MTDTGTVAALPGNFHFSDEQVRPDRPAVYAELGKGPPRWSDAYGGRPRAFASPPFNVQNANVCDISRVQADCVHQGLVIVASALDRSGGLSTC
jgi:hypothetical protein